jgi:hypothetical protein
MCAHYSWSWDYLHWGIRWPIMQRILIDAPSYKKPKTEDADDSKHKVKMKLTPENGSAIASFINGLSE